MLVAFQTIIFLPYLAHVRVLLHEAAALLRVAASGHLALKINVGVLNACQVGLALEPILVVGQLLLLLDQFFLCVIFSQRAGHTAATKALR